METLAFVRYQMFLMALQCFEELVTTESGVKVIYHWSYAEAIETIPLSREIFIE